MTRDKPHATLRVPIPILKIGASGLDFPFSLGPLYHQAAHLELQTLSGIYRRSRCKKSKVSRVSCLGFLHPRGRERGIDWQFHQTHVVYVAPQRNQINLSSTPANVPGPFATFIRIGVSSTHPSLLSLCVSIIHTCYDTV